MKKFKSFGFWTALAGAVTILVNALGKCFGFSIDNQIVSDVIMAVAGVLVVLGVVTMPKKENKENSQDQTQEKTPEEEEKDEEEK